MSAAVLCAGAAWEPLAFGQGQSTIEAVIAGASAEKTMENAKRRVPAVAPVLAGGTRYEVLRSARSHGFAQNGGVIAATDIASGRELWTLLVYQTEYDAQEEADAQDVFITRMSLSKDGKHLLVENEAKQSYNIDLTSRSVTSQP